MFKSIASIAIFALFAVSKAQDDAVKAIQPPRPTYDDNDNYNYNDNGNKSYTSPDRSSSAMTSEHSYDETVTVTSTSTIGGSSSSRKPIYDDDYNNTSRSRSSTGKPSYDDDYNNTSRSRSSTRKPSYDDDDNNRTRSSTRKPSYDDDDNNRRRPSYDDGYNGGKSYSRPPRTITSYVVIKPTYVTRTAVVSPSPGPKYPPVKPRKRRTVKITRTITKTVCPNKWGGYKTLGPRPRPVYE
ncbi:hypothetical protein AYI70_g8120 [Smittium culicis]|uniref:Uncharacterized protein n=1 Tax=Smittium culicis TaxID=133412 RepID=A0A1R1XHA0_9FUNG|nr:hypothetical protein AYI70_g8162 [Smittium culicis]OMJ14063.1 hypothetical protein AYI70_g8120 [Smittium culicis]